MEELLAKVKSLKNTPGIYKFYSKGEIVYIGKSKTIRNRVMSYFRNKHERDKLYVMMDFVDNLEIEYTDTHLEARILEYEQIKQFQPLYNAQYKRDRGLFYLVLKNDNKLFYIEHENTLNQITMDEELVIGPFLGRNFLFRFIEDMDRILPIQYDGDYKFEYRIMRNKLDKNEVQITYDYLRKILTDIDEMQFIIESLNKAMIRESDELRFERANFYKILISHFEYIRNNQEYNKFVNNRFIFREQDYFLLIDKGHIILKDKDLNTIIEKSKSIKFKPFYSEEAKYIVFNESKSDDIEIILM